MECCCVRHQVQWVEPVSMGNTLHSFSFPGRGVGIFVNMGRGGQLTTVASYSH